MRSSVVNYEEQAMMVKLAGQFGLIRRLDP
jgi:hypothetical protein